MIKRSVVAVLVAAAALTAGCSSTVAGAPAPAEPPTGWSQYAPQSPEPTALPSYPSAPAATVAQDPRTNARGNFQVALGETGELTVTSTGAPLMEFAVQGMKRHKGCDNPYIDIPEGMVPVSVDMTVNTYDDPTGNLLSMISFGSGWEYIAPDGTSFNANEHMVCDYDLNDFKPNRKYTGTVWLTVPADAPSDGTGYLVWTRAGSNTGYEWAFTG